MSFYPSAKLSRDAKPARSRADSALRVLASAAAGARSGKLSARDEGGRDAAGRKAAAAAESARSSARSGKCREGASVPPMLKRAGTLKLPDGPSGGSSPRGGSMESPRLEESTLVSAKL